VVGSRRLARALRTGHARWRLARGEQAWPTPSIQPWPAWVAAGLQAAGLPPAPPEGSTQALWVRAIADDGDPGVDPAGLAPLAQQAAALMHGWRLAEHEVRARGGATTARFLTWRQRVAAAVAAAGWTLPWAREDALRAAASDSAPLILCGIEELDLQQQDLIDALSARTRISYWEPAPVAAEAIRRVACNDPDAEFELALRWAAGILTAEPEAEATIVVPDLEARHATIRRTLDRVLDPARLLPGAEGAAIYDIAVGTPLAAEPAIAAALDALAALSSRADFDTLSRWLRSAWFGHDAGASVATELELRERAHRSPGWGGLVHAARRVDAGFGSRCAAIATARAAWPRRALPSRWATVFQDQLLRMDWQGSAASRVSHARDAWRDTLASMAHLDADGTELDAAAALAALRRAALAQRFQVESPGARLKVMGLLELAGLRTHALWVCGLSDDVWPRAADPNPLLPIQLQREAGVPHASPERELEFAERVTAGLASSASRVVLSWPQRRGDEALRPSPLLIGYPEGAADQLPLLATEPPALLARDPEAMEAWTERPGPAMSPGSAVRGGSWALQEQSRCPFRGYARARLDAGSLERPVDGIPARERGIRAHELMEAFWKEVGGSAGLAALDDAALTATLDRLATPLYARYAERRPDLSASLRTEQRLMVTRAATLIASERGRPAFTTTSEKPESVTVGGAALRLKLDRVDRHLDGRISIIDYKTGRQDDGPWFGERPEMPQLPLYAVTQGAGVRAVAFGSLHARTTKFVGVAADADLLPGIVAFDERDRRRRRDADDFEGQLVHWRRVLTELGAELLDGRADLAPAKGACASCDLAAFCRIDELMLRAEDEGEDDD